MTQTLALEVKRWVKAETSALFCCWELRNNRWSEHVTRQHFPSQRKSHSINAWDINIADTLGDLLVISIVVDKERPDGEIKLF